MRRRILFFEIAGSTIASDGDVLSRHFALLPLVIIGEYLGDRELGRTLIPFLLVLAADQPDLAHPINYFNSLKLFYLSPSSK